jgi:hypothetical protein
MFNGHYFEVPRVAVVERFDCIRMVADQFLASVTYFILAYEQHPKMLANN